MCFRGPFGFGSELVMANLCTRNMTLAFFSLPEPFAEHSAAKCVEEGAAHRRTAALCMVATWKLLLELP